MKSQFKIGANAQIITPPLGTPLYGYTAERPAASVHDDLRVTALAIENGDTLAMLIGADICNMPKSLIDVIRENIFAETGIPCENISHATTHTHSGPAIIDLGAWGSSDQSYISDILIPQTVKAAKKAFESRQYALMGTGTTESLVGVNRRELTENGKVVLGQNPFGIFDKTMTVLSFKSLSGESIANIIHYGCHGTSSGRATAITRDWPGHMVDRMEKETGGVTVFFNAAIGDAGPRLTNKRTVGDKDISVEKELIDEDLSYLEELEAVAATDAMRAYNSIKSFSEVSFDMIKAPMHLPFRKVPTLAEAEKELKDLETNKNEHAGVQSLREGAIKEIIDFHKNNREFRPYEEIDHIIYLFNSVAWVPFPFEMFSEIALRLKEYSPFDHTLCISNANGLYAYLPTHDQLIRGGYEVDVFMYLGGAHCFADNTDDVIISENLRIMREYLNKKQNL